MPKRQAPIRIHHPVVWVTGASRGIGREIAKQFAMIGCHVCVSARSADDLKSLVEEVISRGGSAYAFPCDISRPASVARTAGRISARVGNVEVLVNNAGVTVFKSFLATTPAEFEQIIATNLLGHISAIKAVLPPMVRRREGWIINILSTASCFTFEGAAAYTAAKAGLHGLSRVLREEMRPHGIKVTDVLPGPTVTPMWSATARKNYAHRMMSAKSVAEAVLALYTLPADAVPEELLLRPLLGDIS